MAYGPDAALFVQDGPASRTARAAAARKHARLARWQKLAEADRLNVVEQALKAPTNGLIDDYPVAL